MRACKLNLTIGSSLNELLIGVALVALLNSLDALTQITLFLLVEALLVILVAQVVNDGLPLLDDSECSVLEIVELSLPVGIKRNHLGNF